jgi:lipoate-protein ligase B
MGILVELNAQCHRLLEVFLSRRIHRLDTIYSCSGLDDFRLLDLGLVHYNDALRLQLELHDDVKIGRLSGALMLLEHHPVITIGAGAAGGNLLVSSEILAANGIELVTTDRGGDVTYHGPGQLVGYPIINLRRIGSDVHGFLRLLEDVVIAALAGFGITGSRNGPAGVWVGDKKVCSIGISVRGGVTYHGFALNICPDLSHFRFINPCGLQSSQISSLERLVDPAPDMDEVRARVAECFMQQVNLRMG